MMRKAFLDNIGFYHAKAHFPLDCSNYVTFEVSFGYESGSEVEVLSEKLFEMDPDSPNVLSLSV